FCADVQRFSIRDDWQEATFIHLLDRSLSHHVPTSALQHFAAVLPSRAELQPSTLRCCSPLTRRSQPSNTSLLFSPHAPKSTLQQFAPVLPSRAEFNPPTLRCCPPLMHRTQPFNCPLLFSTLAPLSA